MGKRKSMNSKMASRKKPATKLETAFCCPFCNHPSSVECEIDLKLWVAQTVCDICKESYSTMAHALTEPIDIYSEWIDECEKANQDVDARDYHKRQRQLGSDDEEDRPRSRARLC